MSSRTAHGAASTMVDAGVYRYILLPAPTLTLKLSGLRSGALRLGRSLTASGRVTPSRYAGIKVKLTVQRKRGTKWVTLKPVTRTSSSTGAYSWKYKPGKRGNYRLQAAVAKTTKTAGAATKWRMFKVK